MLTNAVELTVEQAWYIADALGAGSFPWLLAITPPYSEHSERAEFDADQIAELTEMGVITAEQSIDPGVAQWIRLTCHASQWLEMRFVTADGDLLRGIIARRNDATVVALRNAELVTFTEMDIGHPQALVPVLAAGLTAQPPARFPEFSLPARIGARADEQIRNGTPVPEVLDFFGIPGSARPVVESVYGGRRSYVEIVAGQHRDGHRITTDVGVGIVDTPAGRVVVSPTRAFDGEWVSTFASGTPFAIAAAVDRLTAALPDGSWFPDLRLTRDFDERTANQGEQCPIPL
ncbi:MAG: ESX secretion-associated protein EspG [Mycobacterium sp.]